MARAAERLAFVSEESGSDVLPHLLRHLNDQEPEVRFWCCFALEGVGSEAEIPALEALLDDTSVVPGWWSVRREARWAIDCLRERALCEREGRLLDLSRVVDPIPGEI